MEIYTKHSIGFTVSRIGAGSKASGIQTDRFVGWAYGLVIGP